MTSPIFAETVLPSTIASSSTGKAITRSVKRETTESTQPTKKAARVPSVVPISSASSVAPTATVSETRPP